MTRVKGEGPGGADTQAEADITVAVIDDHEILAASLVHVLDREPGITCVGTGGTLQAARDIVEVRRPDVIILDHGLPDGSGVASVTELLHLEPKLKIIILTATPTDGLVFTAVSHGAAGFLSKARSLAEVTSAVRSAAAGDAVVSPDLLARLLESMNKNPDPGRRERLTAREQEVLELLAEGLTNRAIASRLTLSLGTVRNHVSNLSAKLDAHSKLEALSIAMRQGLLKDR